MYRSSFISFKMMKLRIPEEKSKPLAVDLFEKHSSFLALPTDLPEEMIFPEFL